MKIKYKEEVWDAKMGPVPPSFVVEIINMVENGTISRPNAKEVLDTCFEECWKAVILTKNSLR